MELKSCRPTHCPDIMPTWHYIVLSTFDGVCVDTGAQVSNCGRNQAIAYCKSVNIPFVLRARKMQFKFGNAVKPSLAVMKCRLPCPYGGRLDLDNDLVDLDIPMLLGLLELRRHSLFIDYLADTIENKDLEWRVLLVGKYVHHYWAILWTESIYTRAQIEPPHKHFFHPNAQKLYDLINRSCLGQFTPEFDVSSIN